MRKTRLSRLTAPLAFVLLAAISFTSCQKSDIQQSLTEDEILELREYVASTKGVELSKVAYSAKDGALVVDNDGFVSVTDARIRMQSAPAEGGSTANRTMQRVHVYTVSAAKRGNIKVYADASVPTDWVAALDNAIANWNSTNSAIYISRVTSSTTTTTTSGGGKGKNGKGGPKNTSTSTSTSTPSYDILVTTMYNNTTSTIAQAYYPDYYGNPGKSVTINTYYNYLAASYKLFAITHELGHNIGFTHTDGTYGSVIAGTPEVDPNSVMNSFVLPWSSFTPYDVTAVNTVYPK